MMELYWDLVIKYCLEYAKEGSETFIESFDGQHLHLVPRDIKAETIRQYLFDQETLYIQRSTIFMRRLRECEDPNARIQAKMLQIFSKESIFNRRIEFEENMVKNTVQFAMRAFRKLQFVTASPATAELRKAVKGGSRLGLSQSPMKQSYKAMKLQPSSTSRSKASSKSIRRNVAAGSPRKPPADTAPDKQTLKRNQLKLAKLQAAPMLVSGKSRFDKQLNSQQLADIMAGLIADKNSIIYEMALEDRPEMDEEEQEKRLGLLGLMVKTSLKNDLRVADPEFVPSFDVFARYMQRAYL